MLQLPPQAVRSTDSGIPHTQKISKFKSFLLLALLPLGGARTAFIHPKPDLRTPHTQQPVFQKACLVDTGSTKRNSPLFASEENANFEGEDFQEYYHDKENEIAKGEDLAQAFSAFMNTENITSEFGQFIDSEQPSDPIDAIKERAKELKNLIRQIPRQPILGELPYELTLEKYGTAVRIYYEQFEGRSIEFLESLADLSVDQIKALNLDVTMLTRAIQALSDWASPNYDHDMISDFIHKISDYVHENMDHLPESKEYFELLKGAYVAINTIPERQALISEFLPPLGDYFGLILDNHIQKLDSYLTPNSENPNLAREKAFQIIALINTVANPDATEDTSDSQPVEMALCKIGFPVMQEVVYLISTYLMTPELRGEEVDFSELMGLDECQLACLEYEALLAFLVKDIDAGMYSLTEAVNSLGLIHMTASEVFQEDSTMESALEIHRHFKTFLSVLKKGIKECRTPDQESQLKILLDLIAMSPGLTKTEISKFASYLERSELQKGKPLSIDLKLKAFSWLALNEIKKGSTVNKLEAIRLQKDAVDLAEKLAPFDSSQSKAWTVISNIQLLKYQNQLKSDQEKAPMSTENPSNDLKMLSLYKKVSELVIDLPASVAALNEEQRAQVAVWLTVDSLDSVSKQDKAAFHDVLQRVIGHVQNHVDADFLGEYL